jgi:hypothetical protein
LKIGHYGTPPRNTIFDGYRAPVRKNGKVKEILQRRDLITRSIVDALDGGPQCSCTRTRRGCALSRPDYAALGGIPMEFLIALVGVLLIAFLVLVAIIAKPESFGDPGND